MSIDQAVVAALGDRTIGPEHKGMPPASWGHTVREFLATAPTLDQLETPILTVDRAAVSANVAVMADWVSAAGMRLAPHGKTTMAPQLWAEQLAAGSWGITLATIWQTQVARSFGVARVLLANALVDPVGLHWVAAESANDPSFEFVCWADSVETVALMQEHLSTAPGAERVRVLVELGGPQGRTGARTVDQALAVAEAIDAAARLSLAGVGGYEGALAHDRTPNGIHAVRDYLDELARLHREIDAAGLYRGPAIVTAGAAPTRTWSWNAWPCSPTSGPHRVSRPRSSCGPGPISSTTTAFTRAFHPWRRRGREAAALGDARLGADALAPGARARPAGRGEA